jgi:hypothetical protein
MSKWSRLSPSGTEEEIKARRNAFLKKHAKDISEKANGKTALDALKRVNPILAVGRVLKGVDDSFVDPTIKRFKNLMRKIKK